MPVPYSTMAIANNFIERFGNEGGIEHMKLQKLVYCSYGWWLTSIDEGDDALTTESPEVWRHGPVFENLYHTLKVFGRKPITEMVSAAPFADIENVDANDEKVRELIEWIWNRYGHLTAFSLSDMTHKKGTPWHTVAVDNNFRVPFNTSIPDKLIREEFKNLSGQG